MNRQQNRYSQSEVIEYRCLQGPDGVYYPVQYQIIGVRRKINGQPVDQSGAPERQ